MGTSHQERFAQRPFETRRQESKQIRRKYPDRVPVICERLHSCTNLPDLDKRKYLVPQDLTVGQFVYVVRKRLTIGASDAIFLHTAGRLPPSSHSIGALYSDSASEDGFLYLMYSGENVFG